MRTKIIKDYPNYTINTLGKVWSIKRQKYLKQDIRNGYPSVTLCENGLTYRSSIHRLVTQHFIPNPLNKSQVNHINGNKTDNRVENLEWITPSENTKHAYETGLISSVSCCENKKSKHTTKEHNQIMELHYLGYSTYKIVKMLNLKISRRSAHNLIERSINE